MNSRKFAGLLSIHAGLILLIYRIGFYYYGGYAYSYYNNGIVNFLFPNNSFPYAFIGIIFLVIGVILEVDRLSKQKKDSVARAITP
jgi:hypothetical protein